MMVSVGLDTYEIDACTCEQAAMKGLCEHIKSTYVDVLPSTMNVDDEIFETDLICKLIVLSNNYERPVFTLEPGTGEDYVLYTIN